MTTNQELIFKNMLNPNKERYLNTAIINYYKEDQGIPNKYSYIPIGGDFASLNMELSLIAEDESLKDINKSMHNFIHYNMQKPIEIKVIKDKEGNIIDKEHLIINPFEECENVKCFLIPAKFDENDNIDWNIKCHTFNTVETLKRIPSDAPNCIKYRNKNENWIICGVDIFFNKEGVVTENKIVFKMQLKNIKTITDIDNLITILKNYKDIMINDTRVGEGLVKNSVEEMLSYATLIYKYNKIRSFLNSEFKLIEKIDSENKRNIEKLYEILCNKEGCIVEPYNDRIISYSINEEFDSEELFNGVQAYMFNYITRYEILNEEIILYVNVILDKVRSVLKDGKVIIQDTGSSRVIKHYHLDKAKSEQEFLKWKKPNALNIEISKIN